MTKISNIGGCNVYSTPANLYQDLVRRGIIAQSTDPELERLINEGGQTIYVGCDATAPSLHVGSLIPLLVMRRFQEAGHKVVLLIGGATTMIGDPSGRNDVRKMLTTEEIAEYTEAFKLQFARFVDLSSSDKAVVVNNADWLMQRGYLEFLREVGTHFPVSRMLNADCYKQRMDNGLTFLELNYMIMQGYDFVHLNDKLGCRIQVGGDDQWSNILGGVTLARKMRQKTVYGLTFNLLTNSEGVKMGKTQRGTVWLDEDMTKPYELYQYFRNVDDKDVIKCLNFLTFIPTADIEAMVAWEGAKINRAKEILAYEVTKIVHGEEIAKMAAAAAVEVFSNSGNSDGMPTTEMPMADIGVLDVLIAAGVTKGKGEGRKLIEGKGLSINDELVSDFNLVIKPTSYSSAEIIIRRGKKNFHKVKFI